MTEVALPSYTTTPEFQTKMGLFISRMKYHKVKARFGQDFTTAVSSIYLEEFDFFQQNTG